LAVYTNVEQAGAGRAARRAGDPAGREQRLPHRHELERAHAAGRLCARPARCRPA